MDKLDLISFESLFEFSLSQITSFILGGSCLQLNSSGSNNTSFPSGAMTDIKQFAVANLTALLFITKLFLKSLVIKYYDLFPPEDQSELLFSLPKISN